MAKVRAITKKAGMMPRSVCVSTNLKSLQTLVGGYIEPIMLPHNVYLLVNEDGNLRGLPPNFTLDRKMIVGDVVFIGIEHGEFADLPLTYEEFKAAFPGLWPKKKEDK